MNKKAYAFSIEPSGFYNDILNAASRCIRTNFRHPGCRYTPKPQRGPLPGHGRLPVNLTFNYKGLTVAGGFTYTGVSQNVTSQDAGLFPFLYYPEARANVSYTWEKRRPYDNVFY